MVKRTIKVMKIGYYSDDNLMTKEIPAGSFRTEKRLLLEGGFKSPHIIDTLKKEYYMEDEAFMALATGVYENV